MMSDSSHTPRADGAVRLAVFTDAAELPRIADLLTRLRQSTPVLQPGGLATATAWCASHPAPDVLLVDLGTDPHPVPALQTLAGITGPSCRIVALGRRHDVDLYRRLLQAGLFDYLVAPLQLDLLAETLQRAEADQPLAQVGARAGRTVAVTGAGGGVGTSTLVASLGRWLADTRQTPTVLVDFDRRKGDLPLLLGVEADAGLAHLLAAGEIDPRLIQRTLVSTGQTEGPARLQLLAQRAAAETAIHPERALELGGALCQLFSLSLWDLPSHRPTGSDEVLSHADVRILLTELSVQGARNTHRLLADIGDESAGQRLLLVTVARQSEAPALTAAQFSDFVGRRIDLALPFAGTALSNSLLHGALDLAAAPAYAAAVARLGGLLLGLPEAKPEPGGLGGQISQWWRRASGAPARRAA